MQLLQVHVKDVKSVMAPTPKQAVQSVSSVGLVSIVMSQVHAKGAPLVATMPTIMVSLQSHCVICVVLLNTPLLAVQHAPNVHLGSSVLRRH